MHLLPEVKEAVDSVLNSIIDRAWDDVSMYDKYADDLWKKARVLKSREPV